MREYGRLVKVVCTAERRRPWNAGGALWRAVASAAHRAEAFLVGAQDGDGFWRDYVLPPGAGEAWVTGVALYALESAPRASAPTNVVERGLYALSRSWTTSGWGYNRVAPPDADSTAWCTLAASRSGCVSAVRLASCLLPFIDSDGFARTYRDTADRAEWEDAHADVTPVVGLALRACGVDRAVTSKIREAVLRSRQPGGAWPCYWWDAPSYAAAWSLAFLAVTGGVPPGVATEVDAALRDRGDPENDFERSHRILAALHLGLRPELLEDLDALLERQRECGSFAPSKVLRLPSGRADGAEVQAPTDAEPQGPSGRAGGAEVQAPTDAEPQGPNGRAGPSGDEHDAPHRVTTADEDYGRTYADLRGVMTSAMALLAMKALLRHVERYG